LNSNQNRNNPWLFVKKNSQGLFHFFFILPIAFFSGSSFFLIIESRNFITVIARKYLKDNRRPDYLE